jgi:hypothetical protein
MVKHVRMLYSLVVQFMPLLYFQHLETQCLQIHYMLRIIMGKLIASSPCAGIMSGLQGSSITGCLG